MKLCSFYLGQTMNRFISSTLTSAQLKRRKPPDSRWDSDVHNVFTFNLWETYFLKTFHNKHYVWGFSNLYRYIHMPSSVYLELKYYLRCFLRLYLARDKMECEIFICLDICFGMKYHASFNVDLKREKCVA